MRFAVATPDPAAWLHVRAFDEVAEAIHQGLLDLGHADQRVIVLRPVLADLGL